MSGIYNEDALEQAAMEWLEELGYEKVFGLGNALPLVCEVRRKETWFIIP